MCSQNSIYLHQSLVSNSASWICEKWAHLGRAGLPCGFCPGRTSFYQKSRLHGNSSHCTRALGTKGQIGKFSFKYIFYVVLTWCPSRPTLPSTGWTLEWCECVPGLPAGVRVKRSQTGRLSPVCSGLVATLLITYFNFICGFVRLLSERLLFIFQLRFWRVFHVQLFSLKVLLTFLSCRRPSPGGITGVDVITA